MNPLSISPPRYFPFPVSSSPRPLVVDRPPKYLSVISSPPPVGCSPFLAEELHLQKVSSSRSFNDRFLLREFRTFDGRNRKKDKMYFDVYLAV